MVNDKDRLDDVVAWEEVPVEALNVLLLVTDGDGDEEKGEDEAEMEDDENENDDDEEEKEEEELSGLARAALMMSKKAKKERREGKDMVGKKRN